MFLGRACAASDIWALGIISLLGCISGWNLTICRAVNQSELSSAEQLRYECLSGSLPFFSQAQDRRRAFQVGHSSAFFPVLAHTQCHPMSPGTGAQDADRQRTSVA